nr:MAG TPA: hypothetical protein [Caudoviricetes sp.]
MHIPHATKTPSKCSQHHKNHAEISTNFFLTKPPRNTHSLYTQRVTHNVTFTQYRCLISNNNLQRKHANL